MTVQLTVFSLNGTWDGAGTEERLMRCSLYKQENCLSNTHKNLGMVMCAFNQGAEEVEKGGPLGLSGQLVQQQHQTLGLV